MAQPTKENGDMNVWQECRKRNWYLESDGGGADGWTARVWTVDDYGYDHLIAEEQAHSRGRARQFAVRAAIEKSGVGCW